MPPEIIVNDTFRQCSEFFAGDECSYCEPPAGWRSLGYGSLESCPSDYSVVSVSGICWSGRNPFCCTEGHSGAPGDCENMIRNDSSMECAFLENASNCTLPAGWIRRPELMPIYEWTCPLDYNWTSVNCTAIAGTSPC